MKVLFETNRWIVYVEKLYSLCNGNGKKEWRFVIRKICGNGDDGIRMNDLQGAISTQKNNTQAHSSL